MSRPLCYRALLQPWDRDEEEDQDREDVCPDEVSRTLARHRAHHCAVVAAQLGRPEGFGDEAVNTIIVCE